MLKNITRQSMRLISPIAPTLLTSLRRKLESKLRSEHTDDASDSSDSSRAFRISPMRDMSAEMSKSSGDRASASALSASRLCSRIFCAITGRPVGLMGGRSMPRRGLLVEKPPPVAAAEPPPGVRLSVPDGCGRVGLVSREPASDRGMPDFFFGMVPVWR